MVAAVRRGESQRSVARRLGRSLRTIQRWLERAGSNRLDRVDWADRRRGPKRPINRVAAEVEENVLAVRTALKNTSALGEYGAIAIREEMIRHSLSAPSVRTIGRILERRGALDGKPRIRRLPPPPGWYLPDVAQGRSELDSFDTITGLAIRSVTEVVVLNGVSVHGRLPSSWPLERITSKIVVELLLERWRTFGLADYAQFDNDTLFQGPHQYRDVVGRVIRACLSLGITPVFAPPREPGFQNAIESMNARWQAKVWSRFQHRSLTELRERSDRFIEASRIRSATRIQRIPTRRPFPAGWSLNIQDHPAGTLIFLRRTSDSGSVSLLGRTFDVDSHWLHRLVRAEVNLTLNRIRFVALRRSTPDVQSLLSEVPYELPRRPFDD